MNRFLDSGLPCPGLTALRRAPHWSFFRHQKVKPIPFPSKLNWLTPLRLCATGRKGLLAAQKNQDPEKIGEGHAYLKNWIWYVPHVQWIFKGV